MLLINGSQFSHIIEKQARSTQIALSKREQKIGMFWKQQ